MKELDNKLTALLKEWWDTDQSSPDRKYVIRYHVDGEFVGYHDSTLNTYCDRILEAKRYTGDPLQQIETVRDNLKTTLLAPTREDDLVRAFSLPVYNHYWKGVKLEDVFIDFEYLPEDVPVQNLNITKI